MIQNQLYIEETLIDLPQNSVIALSFAVNSLYEMKTVQGTVSNRLILPPTSHNLKACGFPNDLNLDFSKTIRRRKKARYLQNGVEIIPDGNVQIDSIDKQGIHVLITAGNVDFFELLNGSIRTLDMSRFDHTWNLPNVVSSRTNTDGYVWPIVQYGQILPDDDYVNVRHLRPAGFVHTIVSEIVKETGYKLNNVIEQLPEYDDFYKSLILPFSLDSFVHAQRYLEAGKTDNVIVKRTETFRYENKSPVILKWNEEVQDESDLFSLSTNKYTAANPYFAKVSAKFPHIHTSRTWNTEAKNGGKLRLVLLRNNQGNILAEYDMPFLKGKYRMDYYRVELSTEIDLLAGDQVYIQVIGCDAPEGLQEADVIISEATFSIEMAGDKVLYGQPVQIEATYPDISKKDFLKMIAGLFCAIIHTDNVNQTVHIVPFKSLKANLPYSLDWSEKINNEHPIHSLAIGEYGQNNKATYKKDAGVTPENLGWGYLQIGDENLPIERTLFEMPFAASLETNVLQLQRTVEILKVKPESILDTPPAGFKPIANMNGDEISVYKKYTDARHDYSVRTEPRIAMLKRREIERKYTEAQYVGISTEPMLTFSGDIPFALFSTTAESNTTLHLQTVLENYYPDFKILLNDQRRIIIEMLLTEKDIAELDFFIPVYIQKFACYFYIAKISDVVGAHRLCKVELVKLY